MNNMIVKKLMAAVLIAAAMFAGAGASAFGATPTVTSVTAQQRYPWNGLVDIAVTIRGEQSDEANADCTFAATNSATKAQQNIIYVLEQIDLHEGKAYNSVFYKVRFKTNANHQFVSVGSCDSHLSGNSPCRDLC